MQRVFVSSLVLLLTSCSGDDGPPGPSGPQGKASRVRLDIEPAGTNCANGGTAIHIGTDDNNNGLLDTSEIDDTDYVCTPESGPSSLVTTTPEPSGEHCINGGVRIDIGIDTNGDGVLDSNEIDTTEYVCNGGITQLIVHPPTATLKTLSFNWEPFPGATHYQLLENPDGLSGYAPLGVDLVGTAVDVDIAVHATDWFHALYRIDAHDASGPLVSSNPIEIAPVMSNSIGYVKADNTDAGDWFATSLALSGDGIR